MHVEESLGCLDILVPAVEADPAAFDCILAVALNISI